MPTGECPFEDIIIYFIGELPESQACNAIPVVTDWFTNVQHYIPAQTTWTAEGVVESYNNNMWRLDMKPRHITSDRSLQFALKFLKQLYRQLNINLCLSATDYLHNGRLGPRVVPTLKQYLRIYRNNRQNWWQAWLSLTGCAYNPTATTTYKLSACRNLYDFDLHAIYLDKD